MIHSDRLVVKVGGSLYDHPNLKAGLKAWLAARPEPHIYFIPGGGEFAEAVRRLDTTHGLGEEAAHRITLHALEAASFFLADVLDIRLQFHRHDGWWRHKSPAVMVFQSLFLDEYQRNHLEQIPTTWDFTSDSIAACAAHDAGCELVLLKSTDIPPGLTWDQAAARGAVDPHFPTLVARHNLRVSAVNFRRVLDGLSC